VNTVRSVVVTGIEKKGFKTGRRVVVAGGIAEECALAGGRVLSASGVIIERKSTDRSVESADCIQAKRIYSHGCIVCASVKQKRCSADARIVVSCVEIKRCSANSGVEVAGGDAKQGKRTNCCIPNAGGETPKSVVSLRGGEVGISSIRRGTDGLHLW